MNIAIVNKTTNICENVAVFADLETAQEMFGETHIVTEQNQNYWIGDIYKDGAWSHPEPLRPEPTAQEDLMALVVDTEYRVTLLELGVK